jgi:hypothetical protein
MLAAAERRRRPQTTLIHDFERTQRFPGIDEQTGRGAMATTSKRQGRRAGTSAEELPRDPDVQPPQAPVEPPEQGRAMSEEPDHERIARRAYERFISRGAEPGRDQEDWFEAEREERQRSGG